MSEIILHGDPQERAQDVSPVEAGSDRPPAWEEIEPGRFMPRRVRGSFRGGKLG
jgi:hypothetical protein